VAAVSLIDKGMIYLAKTSVEERFLLANACAALLLQEQIE
jgi:exoribonuclease II